MCAVCVRYSWSVVSCTVLETLPLQAADCAMCSQDRDRVVLERDAALQRVAVIAVDRDGVREECDALSQQVTDLDARLQSAGAERDAALQREAAATEQAATAATTARTDIVALQATLERSRSQLTVAQDDAAARLVSGDAFCVSLLADFLGQSVPHWDGE